MANAKKVCFVIAPIGEPNSETRKRSDQIFAHIIKPVVLDCGYSEPVRADKISAPGLITTQIVQHLLEDDLVIADLTDNNANVFYELAIRHIIRKPVVLITGEGEKNPFDVYQSRTIRVDHRDLDSVDECKKQLSEHIHVVEDNPTLADNPISSAIDIQGLRRSGDPQEHILADILAKLNDIQTKLPSRSPDLVNAFREHYPAETQGTTWRLINNRDNPAPIYLHDLRLQIKRHIANPQTMEDLLFDWNSIVTLPPEELKAIPVGRPINTRG